MNVGSGSDISIAEVARAVMDTVDLPGALRFYTGKPDGAPGRLLDIAQLSALDWAP